MDVPARDYISLDEGRRRNTMKDLHEMYTELYTVINSMPLPTSPDDPEPAEPEEYVEPEWVKYFGTTASDAFEVEYKKALAAQ